MLESGAAAPDAILFQENREPTTLRNLHHDGPVFVVFYLFDWSST